MSYNQSPKKYDHKPGRGSFFFNNKRRKAEDPVYTGSAKLEDGTEVWISIWQDVDKNTGQPAANGKHSVSLRRKDAPARPQQAPQGYNQAPAYLPQAPQGYAAAPSGYAQAPMQPAPAGNNFQSDDIPF